MRKNIILISAAVIFMTGFLILPGCEKETGHRPGEENVTADSGVLDSTVIRSAGTDIASLDANGDGKLLQCEMHSDVISDTEGRCPICKMELTEYTIKETADKFAR